MACILPGVSIQYLLVGNYTMQELGFILDFLYIQSPLPFVPILGTLRSMNLLSMS